MIKSALDTTHYSVTTLAKDIGVSRNTIYRWADKKTKNIEEDHLESISKVLRVNLEWLRLGKGGRSDDEVINQIKHQVAEKGESYKGMDETLSDVELKARSLIRDLESLVDDLDSLKKNRG